MQEQVETEGDSMSFDVQVQTGQNIRLAGEDIGRDQTILQQGHKMRAQDLGLAASIGIDRLPI